jgi:hypothetical protein
VHRLTYNGRRCVQNGPSARREEGAYLNRSVTDEQPGRRPIFDPPGRGRLAVFLRCSLLMSVAADTCRPARIRPGGNVAGASRLEKQPTDPAAPDDGIIICETAH